MATLTYAGSGCRISQCSVRRGKALFPSLDSQLSGKICVLCSQKKRNLRVRSSSKVAESFVAPTRFSGTMYKAANWKRVGASKGYARASGRSGTGR